VLYDEARDLAPHPGACLIGCAEMEADVDARIQDFVHSLAEGRSEARRGRVSRAGCDDRDSGIVAEQQRQDGGHRAAVGGVRRRLLRMLVRGDQWLPGLVCHGAIVPVFVTALNGRNRAPEVVGVFRVEAGDACVCAGQWNDAEVMSRNV
jgi:hypothetical protein